MKNFFFWVLSLIGGGLFCMGFFPIVFDLLTNQSLDGKEFLMGHCLLMLGGAGFIWGATLTSPKKFQAFH